MPLVVYIDEKLQPIDWTVDSKDGVQSFSANPSFGWIRIKRFKGSGYTCWDVLYGVAGLKEIRFEYPLGFSGILLQYKNSVTVVVFPGHEVFVEHPQLMLVYPEIRNISIRMNKPGVYGFMAVHYAKYLLTISNESQTVSHLFSPKKLHVQFHAVPEKYIAIEKRKPRNSKRIFIRKDDLQRLKILFEEIQANPEAGVTVALLSRRAGMSKKKLETLFKFHYQKTIGQFINETRLGLAKKLLKETDLTVGEIATMTGYNNAAAFIKFFRNKTKETPLQFRLKEKAKENFS